MTARYTPSQATKKIQEIVQNGIVLYTKHCENDRMPERNVGKQDVITMLNSCEVKREAEFDEKYGNWKYRAEGFDIEEGELIAITVIFDEQMKLLIVTVF